MYNVIIIKELLQHILSFIPRKIIFSCALTCKHFYNAITIDYNQENVAKNSDMFSLTKIPYSLMVVTNISARNNNIEMFEYLLQKHKFNINDIEGLSKSIGYSGNEKLFNKITTFSNSYYDMLFGICEGGREGLYDKYNVYDNYYCIKQIYKTNINRQKIDKIALEKYTNFEHDIFVVEGYCSIGNLTDIKSYIQLIIDNNLIKDYKYYIYRGLIYGNHYELIIWLDKMCKFQCDGNNLMINLIVKNNFKIFTYLISSMHNNFCNGRIKFIEPMQHNINEINYINLVEYCIEYRRLDMLNFLIKHIIFNKFRYQDFIAKAELLSFNDVKKLIMANLSLFEVYDEGDY